MFAERNLQINSLYNPVDRFSENPEDGKILLGVCIFITLEYKHDKYCEKKKKITASNFIPYLLHYHVKLTIQN